MTEREKYAIRGLFFRVTGDYQQCLKEYGLLIAQFPADVAGHNQVAVCSSLLRDMRTAVAEMRRAVEILPNRTLFRTNLALYLNYGSEFQAAEKEARAIKATATKATLAVAFAQLGQSQWREATETYEKLKEIDALGASLAATGLADVARVEGHYSDAARMFAQGAAADLAWKNPDRAAAKFAALADVELQRGRKAAAIAAAEKAIANSNAVKIRFLAARSFVEAGDINRARPLIKDLSAQREAEPQAYAKIVEGEIALRNKQPRARHQAPDRGQRAPRYVDWPFRSRAGQSGRQRIHTGRFRVRPLHQASRRGAVAVRRRRTQLRLPAATCTTIRAWRGKAWGPVAPNSSKPTCRSAGVRLKTHS